jgi:hypothetical protein
MKTTPTKVSNTETNPKKKNLDGKANRYVEKLPPEWEKLRIAATASITRYIKFLRRSNHTLSLLAALSEQIATTWTQIENPEDLFSEISHTLVLLIDLTDDAPDESAVKKRLYRVIDDVSNSASGVHVLGSFALLAVLTTSLRKLGSHKTHLLALAAQARRQRSDAAKGRWEEYRAKNQPATSTVIDMWLSGRYKTKDKCAEKAEQDNLGKITYHQAKRALTRFEKSKTKLINAWKTGEYDTHQVCADKQCELLNLTHDQAMKVLQSQV